MKRLVAVAILALPTIAWAEVPHIWAAPGLYGLDRTACNRAATDGAEADTAMVVPAFCTQLDEAHRMALGQRFAERMAASFSNVERRFAESLPADATPRARLAHSFIASLRLSRAVIWTIDKPAGTDAFLPITLTLDIVNVASGEVVFTRTESIISEGTFARAEVEQRLIEQFPAKLDDALLKIVTEAASAWNPYPITAMIVDRTGDQWIVNRGRSAGLRTGDMIGSDGSISYAGANYAIIKPLLGSYTQGQVLTRIAAQPVETLAQPTILSVIASAPGGYAAPYLAQLFDAALGTRNSFAPMPINASFTALRRLAVGEAQGLTADTRSLPDYVANISVGALLPSSVPSNVPGVTVDRQDAYAFVELVDRSGRIVFTTYGASKISDEVAGNIRFSREQRRDTAIRNALIDAATKLSAFRPQPAHLPITQNAGRILIADMGGILPLGAQLPVLRNLGRVHGVDGPILAPAGLVSVVEATDGGVAAANAGAGDLNLKAGDVVAIEETGRALTTRRATTQCIGADGFGSVDDRGTVSVTVWTIAAGTSFAGAFAAPVYPAGLSGRLRPLGMQFVGWDRFEPARARIADYCFIPVISVTATGDGLMKSQARRYAITAGYTLRRGAVKIGGSGMQATMTASIVPAGTSDGAAAAMLQQDLASQVLPLAEKAAATLLPPQ